MQTSQTEQSLSGEAARDILNALDVSLSTLDEAASSVAATINLFDRQQPERVSVTLGDGTPIHKFQIVRREIDLGFVTELTEWVITDIDTTSMEVTMKVPTDWSSTTVSFTDLQTDEYEPLTHSDGVPLWGY